MRRQFFNVFTHRFKNAISKLYKNMRNILSFFLQSKSKKFPV